MWALHSRSADSHSAPLFIHSVNASMPLMLSGGMNVWLVAFLSHPFLSHKPIVCSVMFVLSVPACMCL
jgi:hypothetical protein